MASGANIGEGATIFGAIFLVLFLALGASPGHRYCGGSNTL
jgi:hypothetical protein